MLTTATHRPAGRAIRARATRLASLATSARRYYFCTLLALAGLLALLGWLSPHSYGTDFVAWLVDTGAVGWLVLTVSGLGRRVDTASR